MDSMGERISYRRKEIGMTQEELGKLIGVTKATVHKYEVGAILRIDPAMIEKIAMALRISPSILVGWEVDNNLLPDAHRQELLEIVKISKTLDIEQLRIVRKLITNMKTAN